MAAAGEVKKIYEEVIADVCKAVREALSEEGFDDHTLQELKTMWLAKIQLSRALEPSSSSTVDEATTRNNKRTTTMESNQATATGNKHLIPQRMSNIQTSSINSIQHQNMPFTASSNPNLTNSVNLAGAHVNNPNIRPMQQIRAPYNPASIGNNQMKTSHQLDGSNDGDPLPKMKSKRGKKKPTTIEIAVQLDGTGPTVSDDDDDEEDNDVDGNDAGGDMEDDDDDEGNDEGKEDPNPLCSDDDVSDDEPAELFETDNVIVCQYEKISRTKNKWRLTLKSGIMSINGRDYIFNKAVGEADW